MGSCKSDFTRQALYLGKLIKQNGKRKHSIVSRLNMPLSVQDKFDLEYINLKSQMEEVLELTLPPNTEYACANGFDDTRIIHIFYGKCTCRNCTCDNDNYSFLKHKGGSRRNNDLTWRQLETLLFVIEMHKNIIDMSETFSASVIQKCKAEKLKFSRSFILGGETLNKKKLQSTIGKQRKLHQKMLNAIYSVSSRAKVLWAKVRRCVRMHHYAHRLWEYKFSSCAAQLDIESGEILISNMIVDGQANMQATIVGENDELLK